MERSLSPNILIQFDELEVRIKLNTTGLTEVIEDDENVKTKSGELTILLCQIEDLRMQIRLALEKNDVTMVRLTNGVIGLCIGGIGTTLLIASNIVSPTLPVVLVSLACLVPVGGGVGFYSVKPQIPEARLYEILEKTGLYRLRIKALLRLLASGSRSEYINEVCEEVKKMFI